MSETRELDTASLSRFDQSVMDATAAIIGRSERQAYLAAYLLEAIEAEADDYAGAGTDVLGEIGEMIRERLRCGSW